MSEMCTICGIKEAKTNVGGVAYCSATCINSDIAVYKYIIQDLRNAKLELKNPQPKGDGEQMCLVCDGDLSCDCKCCIGKTTSEDCDKEVCRIMYEPLDDEERE